MRLQLMTWPEVEEYLTRSQGVVVPIGATEQHGPSGFIGTDAICAETLAWGVGEAAGVAVAPTLNYGMSEHHMEFPGSVTMRPSTLLVVVRDVVLGLARHGFRRFFFLNGHGGNTATLNAAFYESYIDALSLLPAGTDIRCTAVAWWECAAAEGLSQELFGDRDGDHATASEVSIAACAYPEQVKRVDLDPDVAPSTMFYGSGDFRRRFPDGRMGSDPSLATPEHGRAIRDAVVGDMAEKLRDFLAEE